jgi:hypothetical protein
VPRQTKPRHHVSDGRYSARVQKLKVTGGKHTWALDLVIPNGKSRGLS